MDLRVRLAFALVFLSLFGEPADTTRGEQVGTVFIDANSNGARDRGEAPAAGVAQGQVVAAAADRAGPFRSVRIELDGQAVAHQRWGNHFLHARVDAAARSDRHQRGRRDLSLPLTSRWRLVALRQRLMHPLGAPAGVPTC